MKIIFHDSITKNALDIVIRFKNEILKPDNVSKTKDKNIILQRFRTLARSFPTYIDEWGLIPALTYLCAHAGKNPTTPEELGTYHYFLVVVNGLKEYCGLELLSIMPPENLYKMVLTYVDYRMERKLLPYLIAVKRIAEALIAQPGKEQEEVSRDEH